MFRTKPEKVPGVQGRHRATLGAQPPLNAKLELRAITTSDRYLDRAVMISSVMPSEKYSCSGSPLKLLKGRTTTEGFPPQWAAGDVTAGVEKDSSFSWATGGAGI